MPSTLILPWIRWSTQGVWLTGLTRRSQQIAEHSFSGRRVPEYDIDQIREVIEGPYRIIYHIKPDQVDVVAVIHGAMDVLRSSEQPDDCCS